MRSQIIGRADKRGRGSLTIGGPEGWGREAPASPKSVQTETLKQSDSGPATSTTEKKGFIPNCF